MSDIHRRPEDTVLPRPVSWVIKSTAVPDPTIQERETKKIALGKVHPVGKTKTKEKVRF